MLNPLPADAQSDPLFPSRSRDLQIVFGPSAANHGLAWLLLEPHPWLGKETARCDQTVVVCQFMESKKEISRGLIPVVRLTGPV